MAEVVVVLSIVRILCVSLVVVNLEMVYHSFILT
jgi:hypothetical protein